MHLGPDYSTSHFHNMSPLNNVKQSSRVSIYIAVLDGADVVSHSQTFRLTAEGLESMAAFVQRHVLGRGNVTTVTDRCVKLLGIF